MGEERALPPPPPGGAFTAESTLTRPEFVWSYRAMVKAASRQPHWAMNLVFVGSIALGVALRRNGGDWFATGLIILGVVGLLISLLLIVLPYISYRMIPDDRRIQRLEVTPDGIASGTDEIWISYTWDAVKHVVRGPSATALVTHKRGEGIIIAHRSLDAAQHALLEQMLTTRTASDVEFSELG